MVKGYKNKNTEREREQKQLLSEWAGRSQEWWTEAKWERLAEKCRQRDAGRETHAGRARHRLGRSLSSDAQGEFAAKAEAEQRESKNMWSGCSCCSPTDPARQSLSFSLLLSAARVRPVSVCLAAVKPHAPKPMTKLCVWFIFVAFCVQVLFVFFIIYHYFLPASSFTDPHTHTQAHKLGYRATLRAVWATLRKIKHSFSNSHSRTRSKPTLSRITNNELNKNNKQIKNNYTSRE